MVIVGAYLLLRGFSGSYSFGQEVETKERMTKISEALVTYAINNGRLPCPAALKNTTGQEDPAVLTTPVACASPNGVVPWSALALREEDSLDGWNRKISYRVFRGAPPTFTNGFVAAGGVNRVNCNADISASTAGLDSGQCKSVPSHVNGEAEYLADKGAMLTVVENGTNITGAAFVLISHGETGYGAYSRGDTSDPSLVPAAGGNESLNTQAGATFHAGARSASGVAPTTTAHFDDVVTYKLFSELRAKVHLQPRHWSTIASANFTATEVNAAIQATYPSPPLPTGPNTGVDAITFGSGANAATVFSFAGQNISMGQGATGEGIGSIDAGSSAAGQAPLSSDNGDALGIIFAQRATYFAVTMVDFGLVSGDAERFHVYFFQTWTGLISSPVMAKACKASPSKANFQNLKPDVAFGEFDGVAVLPITRESGSGASEMFLGAFRACDSTANSCRAPNALAVDDCP